MNYREFNNIKIVNFPGVSMVGKDTLALAKIVGRVSGKKVMDVGTGTGFIAIYLASLGRSVEAIDISKVSVYAALENAKANNIKITCYQSNLFENVRGKFDLIIFNPPIGTSSSTKTAILIEKVKSILPRSDLLAKISLIFLSNQRRNIIRRFLKESHHCLSKKGKIVMLVGHGEESLLEKHNFKIYKENEKKVAVVNRNF